MAEQTITPEQAQNIITQLSGENKTLRKMIQELGEKVANTEIANTQLNVQIKELREAFQQVNGATPAPQQEPTEEQSQEEE